MLTVYLDLAKCLKPAHSKKLPILSKLLMLFSRSFKKTRTHERVIPHSQTHFKMRSLE